MNVLCLSPGAHEQVFLLRSYPGVHLLGGKVWATSSLTRESQAVCVLSGGSNYPGFSSEWEFCLPHTFDKIGVDLLFILGGEKRYFIVVLICISLITNEVGPPHPPSPYVCGLSVFPLGWMPIHDLCSPFSVIICIFLIDSKLFFIHPSYWTFAGYLWGKYLVPFFGLVFYSFGGVSL